MKATKAVGIIRQQQDRRETREDIVAVEEPLEILVAYYREGQLQQSPLSVTMRTPGQDIPLAMGFMFTEGLLPIGATNIRCELLGDHQVLVALPKEVPFEMAALDRNFYTTSSCGVCGKSSVEAIYTKIPFEKKVPLVPIPQVITQLPASLRQAQGAFDQTGGIHAAGLFTIKGQLISLQEDVGRHNALDKLIGNYWQQLPLDQHLLLLSGRASFELIQKAAMAGIRWVAAIGAPSSLAIEMAQASGIQLIGFLKEDRWNEYTNVI